MPLRRCEDGRGLVEDLPLLRKHPHPPAQLPQLVALASGQLVIVAPVVYGLLEPDPQALLGDA